MSKPIKLKILIIYLILTTLFASGCWDSIDIDEKEIVTTIMLDSNDDEIFFYVEIADNESSNSSESSPGGGYKFKIFESRGKDFVEARNNLNEKLSKPLYLSGVRAIVMTERFAQDHLIEYLHRFRADETYRKKIDTVVTREDPEELIKILEEKEKSLGFISEELIKTLDRQGKSFKRTTMRLLENISAPYTGLLLPCMGINEEDIALVGYSIVNDNKVNGFLPIDETDGMVLLKTTKSIVNYRIPYKDMNLTIKSTQKKRRFKPHYENGQISFDVILDYKAELLYGDKKKPYDFQEEDSKALGELLRIVIQEEVSSSINRSQIEFNCDYYQFDDMFRSKYPIEFDKMDWYEEYPNIVFNYDVKVKMSTTWAIDYSNNETK